MKKIAVTIMLGMVFASGWAACPTPTDANVCNPPQGPLCSNGCIKETGDNTMNQDCLGDKATKNCIPNPCGGSAGLTQYTYAMLNNTGQPTLAAADCKSCGSTVIDGPSARSVTCRTAALGTDACPAQ
jgi:hypothetical protein